jgi:UDP-N-acetylglucosamine 2-epimerase (non-hydrolysing)
MKKNTVLFTFGTRPEAIKMAPLLRTFLADQDISSKVVLTAQHREMLDQVMGLFGLSADYDFNIMAPRQTLNFITAQVMERFSEVLSTEKPSMVLVHGDTTTTFACALAAFYQHIPVGHVEAGLRSYDMLNPFPEEMNRKLADSLCSCHFCPTVQSASNLAMEGIQGSQVMVTGNTVVDALKLMLQENISNNPLDFLKQLDPSKKTILMTMHRRESWGDPMKAVAQAVKEVLMEHKDTQLLFPVHRNPIVREVVEEVFSGISHVSLVEPLDYSEFIQAMKASYLIISDSGGIQEEAPTLGKPVLLTRKVTERPEGIASGIVKLVGTDYGTVKTELRYLLDHQEAYEKISKIANPFGDGRASTRIHRYVKNYLGFKVPEWDQEKESFRP